MKLVTEVHLQYNVSHVTKLCCWRHGLRLWRHNFYLKMPLTEEGLADMIKIVTMFIKTTFKDSKKVKIRN